MSSRREFLKAAIVGVGVATSATEASGFKPASEELSDADLGRAFKLLRDQGLFGHPSRAGGFISTSKPGTPTHFAIRAPYVDESRFILARDFINHTGDLTDQAERFKIEDEVGIRFPRCSASSFFDIRPELIPLIPVDTLAERVDAEKEKYLALRNAAVDMVTEGLEGLADRIATRKGITFRR